ncbi:MAG TPA: hypothetical protein VKD71_05745 [Gemmataceae bacterium]|nr:hypothetical protein [Gemmataceae bacterium]
MRGARLLWLLVVVIGATAGCSSNGPAPAPAAQGYMEESRGRYWDDLPETDSAPELLAGRWVVSRTEDGKWAFVPNLPFAGIRDLTFADGQCTMTVEVKDRVPPLERFDLEVEFDPAATPKGFDLTGPGSDGPWRWIYKLTRQGQHLLAFGKPEDGRPAGFDPTRHPITLLVCDRAAP